MTYPTLNITDTTQGMDDLLVYASTTVPALVPLILFAIFIIVTLATFYGSKRYGQGDFISSAVAGGLTASVTAILMTLKPGLISMYVLAVTCTITIVFIGLLVLTKQREY